MLDRFFNLIKAMFNKELNKLETPEVLAEQAESQLQDNLKQLKEALVISISEEKNLEKQIQKTATDIATYEKRAATAVQQNNEEIARECLVKKNELIANKNTLSAQLEERQKSTASMRERLADLERAARDFQTKKQDMLTRSKASDATAKANELLSGSSGSSMDQWEQKIREKEVKSEALKELAATPGQDKFKQLDETNIDDELAALKAQAGQKPKLIVADANKETPHKNLPMDIDDAEPKDNLPMEVEVVEDEKPNPDK